MKKNLIYMVGALLSSAILMFSCAEDNLPSYTELAVDKTDLFIQADGNNPTAEVNITAGNGNYKITVANENIATATIEGSRIVFNGLKNGTTTATVMDWAKRSAVITVKVKEDFELNVDKEEVTLFLNEEGKNEALISIISGNGDYKVESSNDEVASAVINEEGKIVITGVSSDFCEIILSDADGNKKPIKVGVCDAHLVLESVVGKACVMNQTMDIKVATGNGTYTAVSETPEIATVEGVTENGVITIKGLAKGIAKITVTDRMQLTTAVEVKISGGFEITTQQIDTVFIGSRKQEIAIIDGSGNYSINAGSSIKCELSADGSKFIVEGIAEKMNRNQKIIITDNVFQSVQEISVNWVDYDFYNDYGIARYYIGGSFVKVSASDFQDDSGNGRVRIRVGTGRTSSLTGKKVKDGYFVAFSKDQGYVEGVKDPNNLKLVKINSSGNDGAQTTITALEIVKRWIEPGRGENDGKYWIRFKEENREEWSYIVAWL